jgi:hypothetical protein
MTGMTRRPRDRTALFLVLIGTAVIVALLVTAGVLLAVANDAVDRPFEVAKAMIAIAGSVAVTGVLGVLISTTLARRDDERERRDERARLLTGASQDLKAGFEKGQVARFMLRKNPTGGMLARQASTMLETRALLQRVQREQTVRGTPADTAVQQMLNALGNVLEKDYAPNFFKFEQHRANDTASVDDEIGRDARQPLPKDRFPDLYAFIAGWDWKAGYGRARNYLSAMSDEAVSGEVDLPEADEGGVQGEEADRDA